MFLGTNQLYPLSKTFQLVMISNVVWKPLVIKRFGKIQSNNYFKEYCWQLKLERHQFCYKRQWTLGCVGRLSPIQKEDWLPAAF